MTVDFALFLSPQGIALAHRQTEGHWALVGEAAPDGPDLAADMAALKDVIAKRGGTTQPVVLVLPDDQILYTSFMAPIQDTLLVEARIVEGLEGLTPYAVADLVHDWRPIEADRVKVAVIAQDTLNEASGFVAAFGFESAGFIAMPPLERFPGMPAFGPRPPGLGDGATGLAFGPDTWVDPDMAASLAVAEAPDPAPAPATVKATAEIASAVPTDPAPQDIPGDDKAGAPLELIAQPTTADAPADRPNPSPGENLGSAASAPPDTQTAPPPDTAAATLTEAEPEMQMGLAAILDLTLDQTITPVRPDAGSAGSSDGVQPDRIADAQPATVGVRGGTDPARPASRDGTAKSSNAGRASTPPSSRSEGPPSLSFSGRRSRAPKQDGEPGAFLSGRLGRLGFGTFSMGDAAPQTPPDAPSPRSLPEAAPRISKLTAQLARLRDASRARPKIDIPAPKPPVPAPAATAQGDDATGLVANTGLPVPGRKPTAAAAAKVAKAPTQRSTADAVINAGLLARKSDTGAAPSMRAGLLLTLVLLVLLILIAVWSVFFLPDSPVARVFDSGSGAVSQDVATAPTPAEPETLPVAVEPEAPAALAALPAPDIAQQPVPSLPPAPPATRAALPDIDAELDLPPLPPLPQDALPSLAETERIYAEDSIWPRPPDPPSFRPFTLTDDIYIASIDPTVTALDAVALADPQINIAEILRAVPPPPRFGAQLERDALGLIAATPEGVLTPEGAFVVSGRPAVLALPRPASITPEIESAPAVVAQDTPRPAISPRARPDDLVESRERQLLGGLTVSELSGRRPTPRPASAQDAAQSAAVAGASLFVAGTDSTAPAQAAAILGTPRAVAASRVPSLRPADIADIAAQSARASEEIIAVAATEIAPPPSIPSNTDVSRAATARNEIRLRDINLIGVTGTSSNRSALVRLPSGRFVSVSVGDRLDGGRVVAIGESSLQYVVNGRNVTLEIPG